MPSRLRKSPADLQGRRAREAGWLERKKSRATAAPGQGLLWAQVLEGQAGCGQPQRAAVLTVGGRVRALPAGRARVPNQGSPWLGCSLASLRLLKERARLEPPCLVPGASWRIHIWGDSKQGY